MAWGFRAPLGVLYSLGFRGIRDLWAPLRVLWFRVSG